ncbi:hypothetical protein PQI07_19140 [Methylobacterium sp. 092160098-2]|uniref:hypothetical protein n=1 Tax=Methylobacterium sp. 092160098-2 TaxID=3025129 RepID=UPI0023819F15|nr:hypothetical protein [Methylobacterium sp. 092160098-2]MDE4912800.1 hypothetical protein [Methylobacterium sp. 092160098-2]
MQFDEFDREVLIALAKPFGQLVDRVATIGGSWINTDVQRAFQAAGISLSRNHYYSVISDISALPESFWPDRAFPDAWAQINCPDYRPFLDQVLSHINELSKILREASESSIRIIRCIRRSTLRSTMG